MSTRALLARFVFLVASLPLGGIAYASDTKAPVYIGLDAEFSHRTSTSPLAIRTGALIAIEEINHRGGVLGGRPLRLVERDNRAVPTRAAENLKELAAMRDLVAVLCGKFSPTVFESLALIHEHKLILLDPWAAADGLVDNGYSPNYVFRLSLRDSWAVPVMLDYAYRRGAARIGVVLPNTRWGESNDLALDKYLARAKQFTLVGKRWFNYGDKTIGAKYRSLISDGAEVVVFVGNEADGAALVRDLATMPKERRVSIISHWGITGGNLLDLAGGVLAEADLSVVQTYTFLGAARPKAKQVSQAAQRLLGLAGAREIPSPVGVAHAYDLIHILSRAIDLAGTTDRAAIRDALERVKDYDGLIKFYKQPFTPDRHEALEIGDVFIARYAADGALEKINQGSK